jgi:hypothetical protein
MTLEKLIAALTVLAAIATVVFALMYITDEAMYNEADCKSMCAHIRADLGVYEKGVCKCYVHTATMRLEN